MACMCVPPSWLVATPWLVPILLRPLVKVRGSSPRRGSFPLLIVPTPKGWKAEYTLASRMQIHESLRVLALLTRGEARTSDPWICSLMLYHLSYLTTTYIHTYIHTYIRTYIGIVRIGQEYERLYLEEETDEIEGEPLVSKTITDKIKQRLNGKRKGDWLKKPQHGYLNNMPLTGSWRSRISYIHTYVASVSELLCLIPILVGSSVATVCPPERDTALRTAVTTVTRVPL